MNIIKKISEWCKDDKSLMVRSLPLGFTLHLSWGGKELLYRGEYFEFIGWTLFISLLGYAILALPHILLLNENPEHKFTNLNVLTGELFVFLAIVAWIVG